jgi:tetratricopeptide (TPR) repeat protein
MKFVHFGFVFIILLTAACSSVKPVKSKELGAPQIKKMNLTDIEKRKFDYFFYEAGREKMKGNIEKSAMYLGECLKIDPTSSASMYELANIFLSGNEVVKAQGLLERAVELEPTNIWYSLLLAQLYQQNKLGIKAIYIYEKLVQQYPENDEYLYGLAQIYQKNNQPEKAVDIYNKLEKKIGLNEVIVLEKEKIYLQIGKNKNALSELEKLTSKYPEEPRYYGYIADYYLYLKDYINAELFYNKVLEKDPDNSMAYFSLGNLAMNQKDTSAFIRNYELGLQNKTTPFEVKFQRLLPLLMDSKGMVKDQVYMEGFFKILIKTHPYEANSHIYLGNYYKATNRNDLAIASYKKALEIEDSNELIWQEFLLLLIDKQDYNEVYSKALIAIDKFSSNSFFYLIGSTAAMQIEKNQEALDLVKKGIEFVGENKALEAQFLATQGDIYYALEDADKAFQSYEESLKIDELNIVVLNNYSYYLTLEDRDLDKAERMSSKCIELEPGNATYLDTYAWVLFKRERYFEAKYIMERAIDNGGNDSYVVVEHYGDILYKNGDIEKALEQWKLSESMGNESDILKKKIETKAYIEQ